MSLQIVLRGRIPSKKNSRNLFVKNGKMFNIPSKRYKEWHDMASGQLLKHKRKESLKDIKHISICFYAPDKRKTDLTNRAESVMDLLVDSGIIEDDNWFIVGSLSLSFEGVDRDNPRAEIEIVRK